MILVTGTGFCEPLDKTGDSGTEKTVSIAAVGDCMLGNWTGVLIKKRGMHFPFDKVRWYLTSADITTGNLEGPHCTTGEAKEGKKYTFKIPPEYLDIYKQTGFDVMNLANNHILDFGSECMFETMEELGKRDIKHCGAGKNSILANQPAIMIKNGIKTAFLGYSATFPEEYWAKKDEPGTVFPYRAEVIRAVEQAAAENDAVVVHVHWGSELRSDPKEYQADLAHLLIDHGADLVLGHHPHILQGVEIYKERLIFYSLGNFTFASYSKKSKTSVIARVQFNKKGEIKSADIVPVNVYNVEVDLQPVPMPGDPAVIQELTELSRLNPYGKAARLDENGSFILNDSVSSPIKK